MKTTVPVRLSPTPEQAATLRAHCQEYISTVNVLVAALDSAVLPEGGKGVSTKDFTAALPSAVKNQALREARAVWTRSCALGVIPVLRKPLCQWNNQHWRLEGDPLRVPVCRDGRVEQMAIRCAPVTRAGKPGLLRIKRTRGKWVADVGYTLPEPESTPTTGIMGVDLGVQVPAVVHVIGTGRRFFGTGRRFFGTGRRFFGTGRQQRAKRRQVYARRKELQKAKKVRAVRKSQGKERRWMRDTNHKLSHAIVSHAIVSHARQQGVGIIRMEHLAGIRIRPRQRTARKRRGATGRSRTAATARNNNRLIATWPFYQLATFIAYTAARVGIKVEWVDPAHTSQQCPACLRLNQADDRHYVCVRGVWLDRTPGRRRGDHYQSQDWPAW
jgi:putative transposase